MLETAPQLARRAMNTPSQGLLLWASLRMMVR
jgi:hypothetical protein